MLKLSDNYSEILSTPWNYYLSDRTFSLPELKLLIDAVQSSKFITEKKSKILIEKLISLTSETNFDLIWDGDFYYLTGYCDERDSVRTFHVDRIKKQPEILDEPAACKPDDYDVAKYTTEVFRMFAADEAVEVTLFCDNVVMKSIVDKFGMDVKTESVGSDQFQVTVKVCAGPAFYRWVFGSGRKVKIAGPEEIKEEYRGMLLHAIEEI